MLRREVLSFVVAAGAGALAWRAKAEPPATPFQGLKRTVAVYQFQTADSATLAANADALTAMLTDALVRDGRFVVVERADLSNIATEQQLGAQASTTAETAAAAGQLIGASLIVRGAVTKFEPNASGSGVSIGGLGGGFGDNRVGVRGGRALMAIALRVIDATTGQVLSVVKTQGTASSRQSEVSALGHGVGSISLVAMKATPLGQAAEDAINKAVPQIVLAAEREPWSALVIEVDGEKVYVNAGSEQNLEAGTVLHVRRKTKDLVDPRTGVVLERLMSEVGQIRIEAVRAKTSTAVVTAGVTPARGDLLQLN
ncbi:MAG TPA: CsgG/HfaB family protein [Caulobacteraceae bacterium]|jgi:curli biogenesis system outer membrane secretion channel CsgG|nr:CsgG/HfaB family protein [Caulobacteraceae bacterium]